MALTFYYLSGSPFAWRVWLALEHKAIDYKLDVLSVDAGDLKSDRYLAINPRGKAPAIVHDGFTLYESAAIIEYLEENFAGPSLWPHDSEDRAIARRMMVETDFYLYPPLRRILDELLFKGGAPPDRDIVLGARKTAEENLALFAGYTRGAFLAGELPSAADYTLYPPTALLRRISELHPSYELATVIPARLEAWREAVQALPYFAKTWPPHWKR
jgi:glutathione S-transferase